MSLYYRFDKSSRSSIIGFAAQHLRPSPDECVQSPPSSAAQQASRFLSVSDDALGAFPCRRQRPALL